MPDKLATMDLDELINKPQTRALRGVAMQVREVNTQERTVELAFSSEARVEIYPNIFEVLSHAPDAIDLTRLQDGASLLFNHDRDAYVGTVVSARVDSDGVARATVRFGNGERASEVWEDIQGGILKKVSVGYRIHNWDTSEEEGITTITATRWEPYEISIVTVPADNGVGIGRSLSHHKQTQDMPQDSGGEKPQEQNQAAAAPTVDVVAERNAARTKERESINQILEMAREYDLPDLASEIIKEGKSPDDFKQRALEEMKKRGQKFEESSKSLDLNEREIKQYSLLRALDSLANPMDAKKREAAAYEWDLSETAAKTRSNHQGGLVIPVDILRAAVDGKTRDIVSIKDEAGYNGTGGQVVPTTLLTSSFVDLLRNRTLLMQLGMSMGGLVGNVEIPKQVAGTSAHWIGEDESAPESDIKFGLTKLSPHTLSVHSQVTRKMLMQTTLDVEALLRSDMATSMALAIDKAGFYGDGNNNAPVGLRNSSGINSVDFSAIQPDYDELVDMETSIDATNALTGSLVYVANSQFRGHAKKTLMFPSTANSAPIMQGNVVNSYRCEISNQITTGDVFFGDWSQLLIAMWGGLELAIDPYTQSETGRIRFTIFQDLDYALRRSESFCFGKKP